jgi:hypothetical protein
MKVKDYVTIKTLEKYGFIKQFSRELNDNISRFSDSDNQSGSIESSSIIIYPSSKIKIFVYYYDSIGDFVNEIGEKLVRITLDGLIELDDS